MRYYSASTNVTTAANGWKVTLAAGAYKLVKVRISVLTQRRTARSRPPW